MSAIAGIFNLDSRPVSAGMLEQAGRAMARRGPDGIGHLVDKNAGLLHFMLFDTPESLSENLPLKDPLSGLCITFHGRLDNRDDLRAMLCDNIPVSQITDSILVLKAFEKWNRECVNHLLGDFALAILDRKNHSLFCARDHLGVKPLYYAASASSFVFATEIGGIFALYNMERQVNPERIAEFFTCVVADRESTFYKNIKRLPPGHFLEISLTKPQPRLECYYTLRPTEPLSQGMEERGEEFFHIFRKAVACRLRTCKPPGANLSGGIDSSSIVCMAANILRRQGHHPYLHTFSGIFDRLKSCDERAYFTSVTKRYDNIIPHLMNADTLHPGVAFDTMSACSDEPFFAPHFFMPWNLLALARRQGISTLLDGHDGDAAISYGYTLFPELIRKGRLIKLFHECRGMSGKKNLTGLRYMVRIFKTFAKKRISDKRKKRKFYENNISYLEPEFAQSSGIIERINEFINMEPDDMADEASFHYLNITQPIHPYALEFQDSFFSLFHLHPAFPFFDKRVIEFCLALPAEQKLHNGLNRYIMRKGLETIVPEEIRKRKDKTDFSPSMRKAFLDTGRRWMLKRLNSLPTETAHYLDIKKLQSSGRKLADGMATAHTVSHGELHMMLKTFSFGDWLGTA